MEIVPSWTLFLKWWYLVLIWQVLGRIFGFLTLEASSMAPLLSSKNLTMKPWCCCCQTTSMILHFLHQLHWWKHLSCGCWTCQIFALSCW
jgi:hypothetical protein